MKKTHFNKYLMYNVPTTCQVHRLHEGTDRVAGFDEHRSWRESKTIANYYKCNTISRRIKVYVVCGEVQGILS